MPFKHSIQWIVCMDLAQIFCPFKFGFQNLYLKEGSLYLTCILHACEMEIALKE